MDAEDLVSETLFLAAKAWPTFDGRYARSWLIKIMKNRQIRRQSKGKLDTVSLDVVEMKEPAADVWHDLDSRVIAGRIVEQLVNLPEEYRTAVELCDVEGLDYKEAAEALEIPLGTIRSRLYRGRRMLRELLGPLDGGNPLAC